MDQVIRDAQLKVLEAFAKTKTPFALAGGTALELYYLQHRFSRDLDFFAVDYESREINSLVKEFGRCLDVSFKLENEFETPSHAKVAFYTTRLKGAGSVLKLDFVEEVIISKPSIKKLNGARVYDVKDIYLQKILTLTGTRLFEDAAGRDVITGRAAVRDMVDIFYLSKKIKPLHLFAETLDRQYQRGLVRWYQNYSRQDVKLEVMDLEIYDKNFDAAEMIRYLDGEVKLFVDEVLK